MMVQDNGSWSSLWAEPGPCVWRMSWTYGEAPSGPSTGSSAATSTSEVPRRERPQRTRLSAKAKPFRSSSSLASGDDWELGSWQPYNPELQDMVYLNVAMPVNQGAASSSQDVAGVSQGPLEKFYSTLFRTPSSSSTPARALPERFPSASPSNWHEQGPAAAADVWQYQSPHRQRGLSLDANIQSCEEAPRSLSNSELVVPVKRTFIHYDTENLEESVRHQSVRRCQSAPSRLLSRQVAQVTQAHRAGTCKPCAYFFAKADGCRLHNSCEFCHLCPPGEIKKRKKQKKAFLKGQAGRSPSGDDL